MCRLILAKVPCDTMQRAYLLILYNTSRVYLCCTSGVTDHHVVDHAPLVRTVPWRWGRSTSTILEDCTCEVFISEILFLGTTKRWCFFYPCMCGHAKELHFIASLHFCSQVHPFSLTHAPT